MNMNLNKTNNNSISFTVKDYIWIISIPSMIISILSKSTSFLSFWVEYWKFLNQFRCQYWVSYKQVSYKKKSVVYTLYFKAKWIMFDSSFFLVRLSKQYQNIVRMEVTRTTANNAQAQTTGTNKVFLFISFDSIRTAELFCPWFKVAFLGILFFPIKPVTFLRLLLLFVLVIPSRCCHLRQTPW